MSINTIKGSKCSPTTQSNLLTLEKVVSKVSLAIIDFFAQIQGFFKILFFGPEKDLNKNVNITSKNPNRKKLKLSQNKTKLVNSQNCRKFKGYEIDEKNINDFLKSNKNLKIYDVIPISLKEDDYKELENLLNSIINNNDCDYNLLISLQQLVNNEKVPQSIKDLLKEKLKLIEQKRKTEKPKNKKIQKPFYPTAWKALGVGLFIIAAITITSYGIYSQFEKVQFLFFNLFKKIEKPIENSSSTLPHINTAITQNINTAITQKTWLELFKNGIYQFWQYTDEKLDESLDRGKQTVSLGLGFFEKIMRV